MIVGSLTEDRNFEQRIAITPEIIKKYKNLGFDIVLSKGYGNHLGINDKEFSDQGVNILNSSEEVISKSDLILQHNILNQQNLKAMKEGDLCFFYHSNIGKEIVGIVKVIKEAFIDKTDKKKRFVAVQVRFEEYIKYPISLEKIKKTKTISHLPLIKQSRLSVMPIDYKSWKIIYKMGKIKPN